MKNYFFYAIFLSSINYTLATKVDSINEDYEETSFSFAQKSSHTQSVPQRYVRYLFFFLAKENTTMTKVDFQRIKDQLIKWDDYCGGELVRVNLYFSTYPVLETWYYFDRLEPILNSECKWRDCYNLSIIPEANVSVDNPNDTGRVAETLINAVKNMTHEEINENFPHITTQVILITNYVTDSLMNKTTINTLLEFKKKSNITFIAFNTALTDGNNISDYFPERLWYSYTNYLQWNSSLYSFHMNDTFNPICDYKINHYTTPDPSLGVDLRLDVYLILSFDYMQKLLNNKMKELIQLFSHLASRRRQYPCSLERIVKMTFNIPKVSEDISRQDCIVEDSDVDVQYHYCTSQIGQWNWFSDWVNEIFIKHHYNQDLMCAYYEALLSHHQDPTLLITDLPMACSSRAYDISNILSSYTNYTTEAPLTVIAIDKVNETNVYDSFVDLFPPLQASNFLYSVNNISDLLPNLNKSIYFCLDAAPSLESPTTPTPSERSPLTASPPHPSFWYLYLIGVIILIALIGSITVFIKLRNKKRKEKVQQIQKRMKMTTIPIKKNQYDYNVARRVVDIWEIPLKSLDINYNEVIGKGAFSIVHSGSLRGRAPILDVYPSISLQEFVDCNVAVKTLPQHYTDSDKASFINEISIMKDIGYHFHLVTLLGCNCSIERPFLVLELADKNLLHWLIHNNALMQNTDINLKKMLLSFSWQVSDGMSYLSSRLFVHRDLAARNILLNERSKAMISDFGLCQKLDDVEQVITLKGGKLPLKWMALESLLDHQFSIKTDVWSYGVLLYEIFCLGQEPYGNITGEGLRELLKEGKRLEQPKLANEEIYELMKQCWDIDPASRPNFAIIQNVFRGLLENLTENYGYLRTSEKELE